MTTLQTTASPNRFGFNRRSGLVTAIGITVAFAVGIVTGIAGQAIIDDMADSTGATPVIVQQKAYYSAGQGEGLLTTHAGAALTLKAHHAEGMGEDRLSEASAYTVPDKGFAPEGRCESVGTASKSPVTSLPVIEPTRMMWTRARFLKGCQCRCLLHPVPAVPVRYRHRLPH